MVENRTNDVERNIEDLNCGNIANYRVEIVKIYTTQGRRLKKRKHERETETETDNHEKKYSLT